MGTLAIRSKSARDPGGGINLTLLGCAAFATREPSEQRSWRMKLSAAGVYARCEQPARDLVFGREAFARDPRVADGDVGPLSRHPAASKKGARRPLQSRSS